jgi:hypothetical protein
MLLMLLFVLGGGIDRTAGATAKTAPDGGGRGPQFEVTATARATIVPGVHDTGNHCKDCSTVITIPFKFWLYPGSGKGGDNLPGLPFSVSGSDSPDGHGYITMDGYADGFLMCDIQTAPPYPDYNQCLPAPSYDYSIFAHWDDLDTSCMYCGIFTSVSGSPPNQIFNIEWRAFIAQTGKFVNFEVRLYENPGPFLARFDVIYAKVPDLGNGATAGVQGEYGQGQFTEFSCNTPSLFPGLMLIYVLPRRGL